MRVVCLGDLVLDVIVRLRQPLSRDADAVSEITLGTGGQAANVAAWVAALGGSARWVGTRADDLPGRAARAGLDTLGVELVGPIAERGGGVIVSLVDLDGERTMCPDRGVATGLAPDDLEPAWFEADHLYVSGYALSGSPLREAATRAVEHARRYGASVSIDLASWSTIRDVGPDVFRSLLAAIAPDVVFANEDEERELGGSLSGPLWISKRGAGGCSFGDDARPAVPVARVVDTTGAGDALAAGWIVEGPELALEAAARCISQAGSMPSRPGSTIG